MEFKICRVCLDRSATISVFNKQDDVPYCVKIMRCVNVVIEEGDGFPDAICEACAADLAVSFEFAQRCESSDKALRCLDMLQAGASVADTSSTQHQLDIKQELSPIHPQLDINFSDEIFSEEHHKYNNDSPLHNTDFYINNLKTQNRRLPFHLRTRKIRIKTGPIKCTICERMVTCHSALELHMRTHTKEKPYSCDYCKKSFSNKHSLKIHIKGHFGIKRQNPKTQCKKDPLQCTICGMLKPHQSAMENHMRTHTGEKPFSCDICGIAYKLNGTLKRHVNTRHHDTHPAREYKCDHCNKVFYAKSNIIIHMRVHTGAQPYQCPYCPQKFRQNCSLIRHKRRHTGARPYICDTCGKSFVDRSLLNKHQSVHSSEKKYSCHICNKPIKTKDALKVHIKYHDKTKLWVCSICGMTFTFKGNMKVHMSRKHSERSGTCEVCNKEFGDIEAHMCVHTGKKPFTCKICNQSFGLQRSLTYHTHFKHRNMDKFKCAIEECHKTFPMAHMLQYHAVKEHSARAPHACPHCARGFLRVCDLTRHLKHNHLDTQTTHKS